MKVVPDTNTVVSGLLWQGAPHEILALARAGEITLYTSPTLLAELRDVLKRPKFVARLSQLFVHLDVKIKPETIKALKRRVLRSEDTLLTLDSALRCEAKIRLADQCNLKVIQVPILKVLISSIILKLKKLS